jgi:membrane fusion protein, multidrug efflux system
MEQSNRTQENENSGTHTPSKNNGKKSKGPNRRVLALVGGVLAVVGIVLGIHYYLFAVSHESTDDAFIDGRIVVISPRVSGHVDKVWVRDNQFVKAGDLLVELDSRDFTAQVGAASASLNAAEADNRSKNIDVRLISISTEAGLEEAKAAVDAAKAMIQNAKAMTDAAKSQLAEAGAKVAFAKASLSQAQAEIAAVEAKYQQSETDLKRYQEMARSHTISPQQLDHAATAESMAAADLNAAKSKVETQKSVVQQAEAALKAAQDNVSQAQAQVSARQAQFEQANAKLTTAKSAPIVVSQSTSKAESAKADAEKSKAELEQATLNLSYTLIHAPTGGFITKKNVEPGAFVQVGQSLMAIVSPEVWVTANFKETQLTDMRAGQPVTVSVDTFPDIDFKAHVDSIQRGTGSRFSLLPPENATGNYVKVVQRIPVKIVFDDPEVLAGHLLVPGMSVVPTVNIKSQAPNTRASADPK